MVRPIVNRFKDGNSVANQVANDLLEFLKEKLASQTRVDLAVTGGTVGIATLTACADLPFSKLDLARLHIWWGDERFVESDSDDRNAKQAQGAWISRLNIPSQNIHEFPAKSANLNLDEAASLFEDQFASAGISFDLMLMGMGPDGHIASLFPGKELPAAGIDVIAEPDSPKPPAERISLTFEALNRIDEIWFTVAGADKVEIVGVNDLTDNKTLAHLLHYDSDGLTSVDIDNRLFRQNPLRAHCNASTWTKAWW